MEDDPYEVYEGEQPHGIDLARAAKESIAFECRLCGTHLQAEADRTGEPIICHDCGTQTRVPKRQPAQRAKSPTDSAGYDLIEEEEPASKKRSLFEEYTSTRAPAGYRDLSKTEKETTSAEADSRPADAPGWGLGLFVGLPTAFGTSAMILTWLGLTACLFFTAPMAGFTLGLLSSAGSVWGMIGGVLIMGIAVATTLIWCAVAAAVFWAIVDDAAAGARQVRNWPSIDPTEWGGPALCLLVALILSAAPGTIAYQTLYELQPSWPWPFDTYTGWVLSGMWLTLPIIWLSQLDVGSPWGVLSLNVMRSIWHAPVTWLVFYLATTGTNVGELKLGEFLVERIGNWAVFLVCPLEIASDLLYVWLLGRLAWVAASAVPDNRASDGN